MGLVILFVAQALSAIMGLYTEATYSRYGPQWKENLFYSHVLSLPLFLPFMPSMYRTLKHMLKSEPFMMPVPLVQGVDAIPVASQVVYLVANVLCQYACIRGVNLLAAVSSALTVTIVLNIRKLASLLLSIWLFGNALPAGTILGAVIVFGSGALYSLDGKKSKSASAGPRTNGKKNKEL
jgi:solute carrier family 35 (UDP-xylose/UDP-N-acetylglucosamine transporter), member B4